MAFDAPLTTDSTPNTTTISSEARQAVLQQISLKRSSIQASPSDINHSPLTQPSLSTFKGSGKPMNLRRTQDKSKGSGDLVDLAGQHQSIVDKLREANSLESIESRYSNSSATEAPIKSNRVESSQRALIGTRVVSPPKLARELINCDRVSLLTNNNSNNDSMRAVSDIEKQQESHQQLSGPLPALLEAPTREDVMASGEVKKRLPGQSQQPHGGNDRSGAPVMPNDAVVTTRQARATSKPPFMFAGIAASITASLFFSLNILCAKLLPGKGEEGFEEKAKGVFARGVMLMMMCLLSMFYQRYRLLVPRDEVWVIAMRTVSGSVGTLGSYVALNYISIGDAAALIFSSPVWTSLLSHFILGEPLRWIIFLALPACGVGIVLIAHPSLIVNIDQLSASQHHNLALNASATSLFNSTLEADMSSMYSEGESLQEYFANRWPGVVISLLTSLTVSLNYIVLKFRKETPIQTSTFWLGFGMFFMSAIILLFTGATSMEYTSREWLLLLGIGTSSWVAQSFLQWAFLHEDASVLSIVRTLDVALSFILSALFLDDDIYWTSIVGAAIIGAVVVSFMLNNWWESRRESRLVEAPVMVAVSPNISQKELEANLSASQRVSDLGQQQHILQRQSLQLSQKSDVYTIDKLA